MLKAYVNYPNPKVRVHRNPECGAIQMMGKPDQRLVRIAPETISTELGRFSRKEYTFATNPAGNDMWLEIDFGDAEFESAVLGYIHRLIARHYTPFARVEITDHC